MDVLTDIIRKVGKDYYNGDDLAKAYIGGETPPFGTIDCVEDFMVALLQKKNCESCDVCYWSNHCRDKNVEEEANRLADYLEGKKKTKKTKKKAPEPEPCFNFATCKDCAYATQTNPRICMNRKSIAKHSYVTDTSYCDQLTV